MLLRLRDARPRVVLHLGALVTEPGRLPSHGPSPLYSVITPTGTASLVRPEMRQPLSWLPGTAPVVFSVASSASAASLVYASGTVPVLWSRFCAGRARQGKVGGTLVRAAAAWPCPDEEAG
jgi:hypothetical protein